MGGCLYRFAGGSFKRNPDYEKPEYSKGTAGLDDYEKAKMQCKNKYAGKDDTARERQLLDRLNSHTFKAERSATTVVLDIEVRLNGEIGGAKKCDMVLLNSETGQIMFVEGKVFSDSRVNRRVGETPEAIEQVTTYTAGIAEQATAIVTQYAEHIWIVNALFGTAYSTQVSLMPKAKLLVYETPKAPNANGQHSIDTINNLLVGSENILWIAAGNEPTIDEIWEALCK